MTTEPNLERLQKILVTLLIDYSEEEIQAELENIPTNYKKINRKHLEMIPREEVRVFIKPKGIVREPREQRPKRQPIHKSLDW